MFGTVQLGGEERSNFMVAFSYNSGFLKPWFLEISVICKFSQMYSVIDNRIE